MPPTIQPHSGATAAEDVRAPATAEEKFEQLYAENFGLLVGVAVRKFHVPESDAEGLAQEVFLSYLKRRDEIREVRGWMIGAICHASRYYWRQNGRLDQLDVASASRRPDPATNRIFDVLPARVAAREALEALSPRYQEILRLRYYEGYSIQELALHLGVTAKYTQKLVSKCLRKAELTFRTGDEQPARKNIR